MIIVVTSTAALLATAAPGLLNPLGAPDHVLEPRPRVIDGANLDVHPAVAQGERPYRGLVKIGQHLGGALRPGYPQRPAGRGEPVQDGPSRPQLGTVGAEADDDVVRPVAEPARDDHSLGKPVEAEARRRAVEEDA